MAEDCLEDARFDSKGDREKPLYVDLTNDSDSSEDLQPVFWVEESPKLKDSPVKDGDEHGKRKMVLHPENCFHLEDDDSFDEDQPLIVRPHKYTTDDKSALGQKVPHPSPGNSDNDTSDVQTVTRASDGRVSLTPNIWSGVECQHVNKLPYNIDGFVKFQLPFQKENRMQSTRDGRPWAGFMTSRRSGFHGGWLDAKVLQSVSMMAASTFVDEESSHRHDPPRRSSSKEPHVPPTAKPVKRPCPIRKSRSKNFTRVLDIAKKIKSLTVRCEVVINKHESYFTLTASSGVTYDVELKSTPNCSCRYCSERDVCSHIVWLLLNRFKVPVEDNLLEQRGYTSQELEQIFAKSGATGASQNVKETSSNTCTWSISKHTLKTHPRSPTSHTEIQEGDLKITCNARWTPPHKSRDGQSFTVPRTFHFCLKWECVGSSPPKDSSITKPPEVFKVDTSVEYSPDEWEVINFLHFPLSFD